MFDSRTFRHIFFNDIPVLSLSRLFTFNLFDLRSSMQRNPFFFLLFFLSFSSNTFLPQRDKWYPVKTEQVENDEYLTER